MNDATPAQPLTADSAAVAEKPVTGPRIGVLLVNLGTPDAPSAEAVRRYLEEFLTDPRVIEKDSFAWRFVFNNIILKIRPRRKAGDYAKIWNWQKGESPLKTITFSQAEKLSQELANVDIRIVVDWAMRYGNPSLRSGVDALIGNGCERILVMPLYPQYSAATTATVCDEVFRRLMRLRRQPTIRIAPPYYDDPLYIEALASSLKAHLSQLDFTPDVILASYHGMPKEYVDKGDPYERQCVRTTELLRQRMDLGADKLMMSFQSRFGRAEWLQPYTDQTLKKLAKKGVKNVVVITPGFAADCLETLEEIAIESARLFKRRGGKNFAAIPCLNDSEPGMWLIRRLALRELKGWVQDDAAGNGRPGETVAEPAAAAAPAETAIAATPPAEAAPLAAEAAPLAPAEPGVVPSGEAGAQQVVQVDDADRLPAAGDHQRRDL
jgi:ferrochelatase